MLRHTKISSVYLAQVNPVAGCNQRLEQLLDSTAHFGCQDAFDILEHKSWRPDASHQLGKNRNQRVPPVSLQSHSGRRESLTWWPPNNHRWLGKDCACFDFNAFGVVAYV